MEGMHGWLKGREDSTGVYTWYYNNTYGCKPHFLHEPFCGGGMLEGVHGWLKGREDSWTKGAHTTDVSFI